ncbi:MAG: VWA domain-containing protein [Rhizobium sp.]|nr:VWA domain-containing protein [Rhizobium sp.]MBX9455957.1 VWA domain-containing protein [Rhizobium sp.]
MNACTTLKTTVKSLCRRFMMDRAGNIAMTFAIVSIPLLGAMGVGIDYIRALNLHREIQGSLDAALVAAIKDVDVKDDDTLKKTLTDWLAAEASISDSYTLDTDSVVIDRTNKGITATVRASMGTSFLRILGRDTVAVAVQASVIDGTSVETKNPFSMYLVLDRSGSMAWDTDTTYQTTCYTNTYKKTGAYTCTKKYTKIESLKLAVGMMVDQFVTLDPDEKYIRLGAVSYSDKAHSAESLDWGTTKVHEYVEALIADGGTASTNAFKKAYNSVKPTSENNAHKKKNGEENPGKYIVFMTDGDNNDSSDDTKTKSWCDKARDDGIRVFSIAFMAPSKGQALLKSCATATEDYFEADNTASLVAAFEAIGQASSKTPVRLTN